MKTLRWLKLWCRYCGYATAQECLADVPSVGGLLWRCERCRRSEARSAHAASLGERL